MGIARILDGLRVLGSRISGIWVARASSVGLQVRDFGFRVMLTVPGPV